MTYNFRYEVNGDSSYAFRLSTTVMDLSEVLLYHPTLTGWLSCGGDFSLAHVVTLYL
jgi:hypothetical protein